MVPDRDLPAQIRLFLLRRRNYAGTDQKMSLLIREYLTQPFKMLILVLPSDSAEFGLTIAAIPIVFVLLILAGLAVKKEIKW